MTDFGTIKSYDNVKGAGFILPEKGGDALPFSKSGLQHKDQEPKHDQRYGYDVKKVEAGESRAINLFLQNAEDVRQQQARSQQG